MSLFTGKTLMITGGTGSFGNAVLNRFLKTDIGEIRIFSRDEKKQDDMRHEFQAKMPEVADKIKFYIGDVRDLQSVKGAMHGVDYIFHAAALKQVPSCEFFPMEAVRTNVIGTDNVLTAAIEEGVECVICLSTDKAAYPINAMGITKAIEEKVSVAKSRMSGKTKICCTRYGNVMCSRGSHLNTVKTVTCLFKKLLLAQFRLRLRPFVNFSAAKKKILKLSVFVTARKCMKHFLQTKNVQRLLIWAISTVFLPIIVDLTMINISRRVTKRETL